MVQIDEQYVGGKPWTSQSVRETTRLLRGRSSQPVHSYAVFALGPRDEVLHGRRLPRAVEQAADAGQAVMHDELQMYDVDSDAAGDDDNETMTLAGSSTSELRQSMEHTSRRMRCEPRTSLLSTSLAIQGAARRKDDDEDNIPIPELPRMHAFCVSDSDKVEAFLFARIEALQQASDKKISKAWIKAICPQKQARFPYSRGKKKHADDDTVAIKDVGSAEDDLACETDDDEEDRTGVPEWWPHTKKVCQWREPDHVRKHERNALMLYLLRLRPTPDELKRMNGEGFEPHNTHVTRSWTAFLRGAATPDSLDEVPPKGDLVRVEKRRRLLKEIYEVAEWEEEYLNSGQDMGCSYEEIKRPTPVILKRRRRTPSVSSSQDADGEDIKPQPSISCRDEKPVKRLRRNDEAISDASSKLAQQMSTFGIGQEARLEKAPVSAADTSMYRKPAPPHPIPAPESKPVISASAAFAPTVMAGLAHHHGLPQRTDRGAAMQRANSIAHPPPQLRQHHWLPADTSPVTSFSSSSTTEPSPSDSYQEHPSAQLSYHGQHDHNFPGHQAPQVPQQQFMQANLLYHVPEPQFHTAPSTPMFSRMELDHPLYTAPQQEQQQVFGQVTDPALHGFPFAQHDAGAQVFYGPPMHQQAMHGGQPMFQLSDATNEAVYAAHMEQRTIRGDIPMQQFPHDMAIDPGQAMRSGPSTQHLPHGMAAMHPREHHTDMGGLPIAYHQQGTAMQFMGPTYPPRV